MVAAAEVVVTVAVTTAEIAVETAAVADIAINRAIIYKIKNGEHTAHAWYVHRFYYIKMCIAHLFHDLYQKRVLTVFLTIQIKFLMYRRILFLPGDV